MPQIWKEFCMGIEIHGNYDKCKGGSYGASTFFEKIVIKLLICEMKNAIMCNNKCKYNEC